MAEEKKTAEPYASDLACERRRVDTRLSGVEFTKELCAHHTWERITVTDEEGERSIGRPRGRYDTLTLPRMDTLTEEEIEAAAILLCEELRDMLGYGFSGRLLVAGLGNARLTADSVGPKAAARVHPTMHIKRHDPESFSELECCEIAVVIPGVRASSGLDSAEIISGICEKIKPDAVIAIDSLASRSEERLGKTIQISNTGIFPGSGVGNTRLPLNERSVGAPVFAIGVPTVIDARIFAAQGKERAGMQKNTEAMFVSPKEIDELSAASAKIIALGINKAFGIV